jgi:hypothetical protein
MAVRHVNSQLKVVARWPVRHGGVTGEHGRLRAATYGCAARACQQHKPEPRHAVQARLRAHHLNGCCRTRTLPSSGVAGSMMAHLCGVAVLRCHRLQCPQQRGARARGVLADSSREHGVYRMTAGAQQPGARARGSARDAKERTKKKEGKNYFSLLYFLSYRGGSRGASWLPKTARALQPALQDFSLRSVQPDGFLAVVTEHGCCGAMQTCPKHVPPVHPGLRTANRAAAPPTQ